MAKQEKEPPKREENHANDWSVTPPDHILKAAIQVRSWMGKNEMTEFMGLRRIGIDFDLIREYESR